MNKKKIQEIQELQKKSKARRETGLFVAEGERLVSEVPPELLRESYASELYARSHAVPKGTEVVPEHVFEKLSDTRTPQGILAVVSKPSFDREALLAQRDGLYLVLETIQDPGNLGTIFRTAEGAGVTAIFLNRETADLTAPKTVRSTMGSIFRVPHFETASVADAVAEVKRHGITVYAAAPGAAARYDTVDYRGGTAFLIGNEGNGLSAEAMTLADQSIFIPMQGALESLNAAVAATLLVYETARQREFR